MWDFFFSSTHVEWLTLVLLNKLSIDCSSWVGLLEDKDFIHPNLVLQAHDFFHFCCIFLQQPIPFMLTSRSLHWAPNSYLSNFKVSTAKHGYRIILKFWNVQIISMITKCLQQPMFYYCWIDCRLLPSTLDIGNGLMVTSS